MLNRKICLKCFYSNKHSKDGLEFCIIPAIWKLDHKFLPFIMKVNGYTQSEIQHIIYMQEGFDSQRTDPPDWCPYLLEHTVSKVEVANV